MVKVIGRRLVIALVIMWVVSTVAFFLVQLVPGNPAEFILGDTATPARIHALEVQLGLNKPVLDQYFSWLGEALRGNLGTSYSTNVSVTSTLGIALQPTVSIAVIATVITLVLGFGLGTLAAVRGGKLDTTVQGLSILGGSIPNYWFATLLVLVLALKLHWFPATGYTPFGASVRGWILSLVLPVAAVCMMYLSQLVLQARASVLDVISRDFVRTLQAAGIPRSRILLRHISRNAAIPVVTLSGLSFVFMLGGIVVVEYVFNIPGMGTLMVNAVNSHDLPVLQGAVIYFSLLVIVVNLAVDLLVAWLDPRTRVQ